MVPQFSDAAFKSLRFKKCYKNYKPSATLKHVKWNDSEKMRENKRIKCLIIINLMYQPCLKVGDDSFFIQSYQLLYTPI